MDCKHTQLLLHFYRPDRPTDLDAEDVTAIQKHLPSCPDCSAWLAQQTAKDRILSHAMQNVPVPSGLSAKLQERAKNDLRAMRRRTIRNSAAAAVLALSVYAGFVALSRPTLDLERMAEREDFLWQAPEPSTTDWLAARGLSASMPEEYDLSLATYYGRTELHGVATPVVRLDSNSRQRAWIYFVRSRDFRLRDVQTGQYTSNVAMRVYRDMPGSWTVVVVYTGNNLNAFLRRPIAG